MSDGKARRLPTGVNRRHGYIELTGVNQNGFAQFVNNRRAIEITGSGFQHGGLV